MNNGKKEPLYRKVNTTARMMKCHNKGLDYSYTRNAKNNENIKMKKGVERGLDYTPLYKFLLSKVGSNWDQVYREAKSRLDKTEPLFWMVGESKDEDDSFRNENAYFSKLYVDENNLLQKNNPNLSVNDFLPNCSCCTHTFNGKVITNKSYWEVQLEKEKKDAENQNN